MRERIVSITITIYIFIFFSCNSSGNKVLKSDPLFQLVPSSVSGINFKNVVTDTRDLNIFNYRNFYNGGGVAIGDVNNDGKPDIFFTSNQQENKLYINKGNWQFSDVTESAGLSSTHKWHTGVTMVDINSDGWLDIYVSNGGNVAGDDRANELYVNQKDGTFKENANQYRLDDKGPSVQAIFFDYDHDADLDCFVLNNSPRSIESFGYNNNLRNIRDLENGDHLYRNDGEQFTDVSNQAGIFGSAIGFGLGVTVGDLNNDGWEDMYVSNDFFERDYLYVNLRNGTFKEVMVDAMGHTSQGSMGSDMADINNDGFLDVFTTEMLPESDYRLKTTLKFDDYDIQNSKFQRDYHHQFTSNCLQLNNHDGTFSEVAQYAGVDATGWSWGALIFDFDNNGWKDLFVCNGLYRDLTDQDFLEFFASRELLNRVREHGFDYSELINKMPSVPILNYAFLNKENLQFENKSASLGFDVPSFSNGAAYADLDGDGDLDLVINNVNMDAFVYKNTASEKFNNHFLKIKFNGPAGNTFGYGARVTIFVKGRQQVLEQMPSRGFQSSVEPVLNFGLGTTTVIDSLVVKWPGSKQQLIKNIKTDSTLTLNITQAQAEVLFPEKRVKTLYNNVTYSIKGNIRHRENEFLDFDIERLIPKMLSTEGPKLAVADVNGDGLEDFYMGSAFGDTSKIFIQQPAGGFIQLKQDIFIKDKYFENIGVAFFDADADGDPDLVAASGGNQSPKGSPYLQPRLYVNDGKGNFTRSTSGLPAFSINASCVRVIDFDADGKEDLFFGARCIPGTYGVTPSSILLRNEGKGVFSNVTSTLAPDLENLGMVTDARWSDINGDGNKELVVVGDWMPVVVLQYGNGNFKKINEIPNSSGWWNCLSVADIDDDGDIDLVAGNNGLNSRIKASKEKPARLYVSDFDKNGQTECIPVYYKSDGKAYPYFLKGEMDMQIPMLKKKFLQFSAYAGKHIEDVFTSEQIKGALVLSVEIDETSIFLNDGKGNFTIEPLPVQAQLSPVYGILVSDLNEDGIKDIFLAGNFFGLKPQGGRNDASYGTVLLGSSQKTFNSLEPSKSGLFVQGAIRDIAGIKAGNGYNYIIVSTNDSELFLFSKKGSKK